MYSGSFIFETFSSLFRPKPSKDVHRPFWMVWVGTVTKWWQNSDGNLSKMQESLFFNAIMLQLKCSSYTNEFSTIEYWSNVIRFFNKILSVQYAHVPTYAVILLAFLRQFVTFLYTSFWLDIEEWNLTSSFTLFRIET